MVEIRAKLLLRAQTGRRESANLDFKVGFDLNSREAWCHVIKDVVAFANSGGGVLLFGVNDDGSPTGEDVTPYLTIDPADLTNKVHGYTGYNFSEFEIVELVRDNERVAALLVYEVPVPLVFVQNGSHVGVGQDRRPAFVKGSVYFRHGAKSEAGTSEDLRAWLDRSLEKVRETWLGGIRQVVTMGAGQRVQLVAADAAAEGGMPVRIAADPNAPAIRIHNPVEIWPHREAALLRIVREQIAPGTRLSNHDFRCLKIVRGITPGTHPNFVLKPHPNASPQYSQEFCNWLVEQYQANPNVFEEARQLVRDGQHLQI